MPNLIEQCLKNLAPRVIDCKKCTPATSIYQQISQPPKKKRLLDHQAKQWFNLGNSQTFNEPISAAEYLLEREYGDSFLFKPSCHDPVFIPSEFMSNQFSKNSTTTMAMLDFDIKQSVKQTLVNLKKENPDFWFTTELESFLQPQQANGEINQIQFQKWILKVKVMYLMVQEINPKNLPENLPSTTPYNFIKDCINELNTNVPTSHLIPILSSAKSYTKIAREVKKSPPEDSRLKWFFDLELADCGEKTERSFFDQLYSIKNDEILKDTVILSSVNFLTDFDNKHHQEFDFLIFSWTRKLIIGVEVKRQLNDARAFEQLDKYHSIFEEKLGDQLGPGWNFFPVVCVEKEDNTLPATNHYININTDIKTWLFSVMNLFPENLNRQSVVQLNRILQIIVFTIHISKKDQPRPITLSYWVDYVSDVIDSLSNDKNIVFYSRQQLPLMSSDDPKCNKLFFMAGFGTGKSFLLQEKAITLSRNDKYKDGIYYVVCNGKGLHYFERKRELEKYGIHVVHNVESLFNNTDPKNISHVKAIFFDEWDDVNDDEDDELDAFYIRLLESRLLKEIPICWVAPSSSFRARNNVNCIRKNKSFRVVNLTLNLRNTKEIINKAHNIAEENFFKYASGLSQPPANFPNGPSPTHVTSLDEAVSQVRLMTKKGILVVLDSEEINIQADDKVKFYHKNRCDFSFADNPIDFLSEGKNILVTSRNYISGFEWPVIIYQLNEDDEVDVERNECNIVSRCTCMLYIVGESTPSVKAFPFSEISSMLELSAADKMTLSNFKDIVRKYIFDRIKRFNTRRDWLLDLPPIMKETIDNISQTSDETITFSMFEDLLRYLLADLSGVGEKSLLSIPCAMSFIYIIFDHHMLDKYFTIDYLLDTYTNFAYENLSSDLKEKFFTQFEIESLSGILPPEIINLNIKYESENAKLFTIYAGKVISDHLPSCSNKWLQDILPIFEETILELGPGNQNIVFSAMEKLLLPIITDILIADKNAWITIPSTICFLLHAFKTNNYDRWVMKYLNIDTIKKIGIDLNCVTFLYKRGYEFVWKYFEIENLPGVLPRIDILDSMIPKDHVSLRLFKLYVGKYVSDHVKCFNRRDWLSNLQPILERTIDQISKGPFSFIQFSSLMELLQFLLNDLLDGERDSTFSIRFGTKLSYVDPYYLFPKYFNLNYFIKFANGECDELDYQSLFVNYLCL